MVEGLLGVPAGAIGKDQDLSQMDWRVIRRLAFLYITRSVVCDGANFSTNPFQMS